MAKKVSKASTKKKTTKKSAGSSKKKTAKKPRATTSSTKKKSTKKKVAKKASTKKTPAKKTTTKKKVSKPTPSKKTTTKKAPAKKTTKKAPTASSKKTPTKTSSKKTTSKKTAAKKESVKDTSSKKKPSKKSSSKQAAADAPRFRSPFSSSHDDGLAAAQRLASAAGLSGLSRASQESVKQKKYKKLTTTPFKADQLAEFREMLRAKRRQLVGDVSSMESEALSAGDFSSHTPNHMADQGSDTYDQSLNLDLAASQRTLLTDIDDALMRIENNTYGICELLGKPIKAERLKHTPWARFSIEAARMIEDDPSILKRSSERTDDDE